MSGMPEPVRFCRTSVLRSPTLSIDQEHLGALRAGCRHPASSQRTIDIEREIEIVEHLGPSPM
jgi:hypothetical protein